MTLTGMAWRYLWHRPLVTALTLTGILLGTALVSSVLTLRREAEEALLREGQLFDLVVGAKGSPLQLVLSSIYHLDVPNGNIPMSVFEDLKRDGRVKAAYAIGLGDNYDGYRIVGVEESFFDLARRGSGAVFALQQGRRFTQAFEAVLGAQVARRTGLRVGDTFVGYHGLLANPGASAHRDFPYTVVGELAPTGTAQDRAIFVRLDSVWRVHEAEQIRHGEPPAARQVTSVLVQLRSPGLRLLVAQRIADTTPALAAIPLHELLRLFEQVLGPLHQVLLAIALLVVVVASLSIAATLYQSAERQRRDLAILRTLGAHPREIFALVLGQAGLLALLGLVGGWLFGHGAVQAASYLVMDRTGLALHGWHTDHYECIALAMVFILAVVAGLVPALASYRRTPVSDIRNQAG